jgi:hypothetical protein
MSAVVSHGLCLVLSCLSDGYRIREDIDNTIDMRDNARQSKCRSRGRREAYRTILLAAGCCGWSVLRLAHGVVRQG